VKAGQQLQSDTCTTKVVVVRAPDPDVVVECGGRPMVEVGAARGGAAPTAAEHGTALGKRYVDGASGLELLCVTAGVGDLACNGAPMSLKDAKPLPSSD
jgi:hypothetical protein